MAHSVRDQQKLLHRAHRIRGQVDCIARLLEAEAECGKVLQQLVAVRGAVQGLMAEILEDHVRFHVVDPLIDPVRCLCRERFPRPNAPVCGMDDSV